MTIWLWEWWDRWRHRHEGGLTDRRRRLRRLLAMGLFAWLLAPPLVWADCLSACTTARLAPFTIAADHAGDNTTGYRLWQNGIVIRDVPVSSLVVGVISFAFPVGIDTAGTYTFVITAYNAEGETLSDPLVLTVTTGKPAKPTNVRKP